MAAVSGGVVHAAQTLPRLRVTVDEQHVGVAVAVTVAWLAAAAENHGVAIETRSTPVERSKVECSGQRRTCEVVTVLSVVLVIRDFCVCKNVL